MLEDDMIARAVRAHRRATQREGGLYMQPGAADSTVEEIKGREYVVLRNCNGVKRVYKVRGDGRLLTLAFLAMPSVECESDIRHTNALEQIAHYCPLELVLLVSY
jgi:hypothetical protein